MNSSRHALRAVLAGVAALGLTIGLTACSGGSDHAEADNGDIRIVASTAVWGTIAQRVIDDATEDGSDLDVTVSTILSGTDGDPHEYEATAQDIAKIRDADVIVGNGAGYDNWITDNAASDAEVITAAPTAEGHDHDSDDDTDATNPHIWFNLTLVEHFADHLAGYLHSIDDSFPERAAGVATELAEQSDRLAQLPAADVLLTEPVAANILLGTRLTDITPAGFAHAALAESEPSAADLAAARELITDGSVDVLITNAQSQTPASNRLTDAAKDEGLYKRNAVINVNESPNNDQTYFDYLDNVITALEKATDTTTDTNGDDAEK